jgi:hypothetical protein
MQSHKKSKSPVNTRRRLIIGFQPKGSVGKSTYISALVEWYVHVCPAKPVVSIFDPDTTNKTLTRIFGHDGTSALKAPHTLHPINLRKSQGNLVLDSVMRVFDAGGGCNISVVDGVANHGADIMNWVDQISLYEMADENNIDITFLIPVDETEDTVRNASAAINEIGGRADVLIVRNEKKSDELPWDRAREYASGKGVEIPRLHTTRIGRWTEDVVLYVQGTATGEPHTLFDCTRQTVDSFARARAKNFWRDFISEIESVQQVLLPGKSPTTQT